MKPIQMREADFKRDISAFTYPEDVKQEFFDYWSEPNKSNTKMKFEMETTWHLRRRLARWANNQIQTIKKPNGNVTAPKMVAVKTPENDFERLDQFLCEYASHPADVRFERFGAWYDFMKENKLLGTMTRGQVEELKQVYNNDFQKCRCAVVQMTLDGYWKSGLTIKVITDLRERLK